MKLFTEVKTEKLPFDVSLNDRIAVLGSCFADNVGERMADGGFNVSVNPFGTLYNPASILSSMERLEEGRPFTEDDCVEMGASAGLICSFSHHTSFARPTAGEFLENVNGRLARESAFWKESDIVIVTLGTTFVWEHGGAVVTNCLKRPGGEFNHRMLSMEEITACLKRMKSFGKDIIFTVSPVRHLSDGAHANTISKAALHLAVESVLDSHTAYFPAYELVMDELRDYRFYAEDLTHPSPAAISLVWERFLESAVPAAEHQKIIGNHKASLQAKHRSFR